jgi:hypothetical protein
VVPTLLSDECPARPVHEVLVDSHHQHHRVERLADVHLREPGESAAPADAPADHNPLNGSNSVEVVFRNVGKGPLTLRLIGTNCGCVHDLTIDGKKLEPKGEGVTRMPGEGGTIKMTWTPKPDMQAGTQLRFTADLLSNDPQYADTIRLEVITRLVPPKEGTK